MAPPKRADDEQRLRALARQQAAATDLEAGPCPDTNELVRMAEGVVLSQERARLEAHLARCGTCRGVVAAVAGLQSDRRLAGDGSRRRLARLATVAALLVAAMTLLLLWLRRDLERRVGADSDRALLAAAAELVRLEPDHFAGFAPLLHRERLAPGQTLQRGGVALLAPVGKVIDERPALRWEDAVGVSEWQVSVLRADGTPLWSGRATGSLLAWPAEQTPLAPDAMCLCEVVGEGAAGREEARASFSRAAPAEVAALHAARASIESLTPHLRALLFAQFALRQGFLAEAEAALRAHLSEVPGDAVAEETLLWVLDRLGAREAGALRARIDRRAGQGR